ncbi:jg1064 [Pararge aegeria aegeria]|uniref:Jg1064 protein n=1 Tax=Pararge aegeria aegeria TaxID=348720 RepID=A0A8S4S2Q7_9NEOP|nr:jg1064 [Pararge aegeria aegeria]
MKRLARGGQKGDGGARGRGVENRGNRSVEVIGCEPSATGVTSVEMTPLLIYSLADLNIQDAFSNINRQPLHKLQTLASETACYLRRAGVTSRCSRQSHSAVDYAGQINYRSHSTGSQPTNSLS